MKQLIIIFTACILITNLGIAATTADKKSNQGKSNEATLQQRANNLDALINGNNATPIDKNPALAKNWQRHITVSGQINADGRAAN